METEGGERLVGQKFFIYISVFPPSHARFPQFKCDFFIWKPADQINLYCFLLVCTDEEKHPCLLAAPLTAYPAVLMNDREGFSPETER